MLTACDKINEIALITKRNSSGNPFLLKSFKEWESLFFLLPGR